MPVSVDILWVCAAITTVASAITVIANLVRAARKPGQAQDGRIAKLEQRMDDAERHLDNGKRRFGAFEAESAITRRALLALLGHALTGDNEKQLQTTYDELNIFITGGKNHD